MQKLLALLCIVGAFAVIGCNKQKNGEFNFSVDAKKAESPQDRSLYAPPPPPMKEAPEEAEPVVQDFNTEAYDEIIENDFLLALDNPLSTFSIDVDTAAYSNVRRLLNSGSKPPPGAVRIEEMVNYFNYDYAPPEEDSDVPFSANVEVGPCPWNDKHRLARIALKGKEFAPEERPNVNLVFLLDVSGSMQDSNKLPLVKQGMKMLVNRLGENDRVAIVVYAGAAGQVLAPTSCADKRRIIDALDRLRAGGSTAGGQGIQLAYATAEKNFDPSAVNRVILCSDGDFNVGVSDRSSLSKLIQEKAKSGVSLTVLSFGTGNLKDSQMEMLADRGNGNYGYIDTPLEAKKILVDQLSGTLVTIAKDVKIQVDFNPAQVGAYRLIGYENRMLKAEDFKDDTKDAGEIGAGHTVTALYEIVSPELAEKILGAEPSKYQKTSGTTPAANSNELLTVRLRYKQPDANTSIEHRFPVVDSENNLDQTSDDFRFASAVAQFGLLLRDSKHKGNASYKNVISLATGARGDDPHGYRNEMIQLVRLATTL